VDRVLLDIGAGAVPQILVCNKLDQLEPSARPRQRVDVFEDRSGRQVTRVFVSALEGTGLEDLRGAIAARAAALHEPQTDNEPHPDGQSHLHALTDS
jgi:GTP-binding protein HflX